MCWSSLVGHSAHTHSLQCIEYTHTHTHTHRTPYTTSKQVTASGRKENSRKVFATYSDATRLRNRCICIQYSIASSVFIYFLFHRWVSVSLSRSNKFSSPLAAIHTHPLCMLKSYVHDGWLSCTKYLYNSRWNPNRIIFRVFLKTHIWKYLRQINGDFPVGCRNILGGKKETDLTFGRMQSFKNYANT